MSVADELSRLQELRQSGAINDDEFATAKAKLLGQQGNAWPPASVEPDTVRRASAAEQTRTWAMILHLSLLAGHLVPYAGLVVPIVIWQLKKAELPEIDVHGKNAANWIISYIIYSMACGLLMFVFIGIPLLLVLLVLGVVFPIIAAIKANNGELWKYPLAIAFFN